MTALERIEQIAKIASMLAGLGIGPAQIIGAMTVVKEVINLFVSRRQQVSDADIISAMEKAFDDNLKKDHR